MRIILPKRTNGLAQLLGGMVLTAAFLSGASRSHAAENLHGDARTSSRWSINFTVGLIGDTSAPGDYYKFDFNTAWGTGKGRTYNVAMNYRLHEFDLGIGKQRFQPRLELPVMLTLVDEKELGLFPDYNVGLLLRWRNWPWNQTVYTTVATGIGVSYSSKVWTSDRQRHPGEYRAHLKFWLPIELTFAHPKHRQHHVMLFIDHQSGAHITDEGGQDAWGVGYRYEFD